MKPLVLRSAIVASVGGLIFGFDTAVISGTTESLEEVFGLDAAGLGATVMTALIGTIIGALVAGRPADRWGRRAVLFVIGALYIAGSLLSALAPNLPIFVIGRVLGGLGVGASSVVAPIYTAEVAPPKVRGRLVGLVQFNIVFGIMLAYLSNFIIRLVVQEPATGDPIAWRWMLGVMVVPAIIFVLLLLTVPETPRWLMAVGRTEEAVKTSRRLCETQEESDTQIQEIKDALAQASMTKAPFWIRRNRRIILMAVAIAMFNQLSGINAILYYAPIVMQDAGATTNTAFLMSVGVGAMNLVATMAALTVIDKIGRRTLMIVGSIGYLVSLGFLSLVMFMYAGHFDATSSWLVLVGLMMFIASHAFGQGSVIWVFISEIFPNRIRGMGQSVGSMTHWMFAAITSGMFPVVIAMFGGGASFGFFFLCMVGQLIWVLRVMPETKGIPLEEMESTLGLDVE